MSKETFEHTFEVGIPANLKVSNVRGHVDVKPGEDGSIQVTAIKHSNSIRNGNTQIVIEQKENGQVVAEAKYENSIANWFGLNKPCRVDFTIRVPKACSVKVNCVSSSADIEGLEGDVDVNCVSGNLALSDLRGEFNFSSVSGKIIAQNLIGPLQMNNVSGKVQISESQISSMGGKTVSGHVRIETPLTEGPYEFNSVSGNLVLITPEDTACTIQTKSISGVAKVNLPVTSKSGTRNKQLIEVAGGGPEVTVKSVSGVLKIGAPNFVEAEEPATPEDETPISHTNTQLAEVVPPSKSQMQILQEIENGEISVEEALQQMN
jgi:DUF4097 and DUF4098 domain-containing protein YvlB